MAGPEFDFIYKLIILGDQGVGKSKLLDRWLRNEFREDTRPTIGVEFGSKTQIIQGMLCKIQAWDTAGQERFRSLTRAYYRGATGVIICYDITSVLTFQSVKKWLDEVGLHADKDVVVLVVGNKCDMDNREVSLDEGMRFAREKEVMFMETSAKDSTNVSQAFDELLHEIYEKTSKHVVAVNMSDEGERTNNAVVVSPTVIRITSAPSSEAKEQDKCKC